MRVVLGICLLVVVLASAYPMQTGSQQAPAPLPASPSPPPECDEARLLRAQLETMREYDQRLLATVYWALGGLFVIIGIVGGLNWFFTFRLYERDRDSLRHELTMELQRVRQELVAAGQDTLKSLKDAHQEHSNKTDERVQGIRKAALDADQETLKKARYEILLSRYDFTKFLLDFSQSQNNPRAIVSACIEHLQTLDGLGWLDVHAGDYLRYLARALAAGGTLTDTELRELSIVLAHIPEAYAVDVENIRRHLPNARA
jgi:hypothetical protein